VFVLVLADSENVLASLIVRKADGASKQIQTNMPPMTRAKCCTCVLKKRGIASIELLFPFIIKITNIINMLVELFYYLRSRIKTEGEKRPEGLMSKSVRYLLFIIDN
jgi:hypothetical protein